MSEKAKCIRCGDDPEPNLDELSGSCILPSILEVTREDYRSSNTENLCSNCWERIGLAVRMAWHRDSS